jgi:hypothetical protein
MVTATVHLSGGDMSEDEYRETLAHAKRFEVTNGVVTAKRGPYMTQKSHVAIAEEIRAAVREYRQANGGFGGQTPTTNLSQGPDRAYRLPNFAYWVAEGGVLESAALPDFRLDLARLWAAIDAAPA